MASVLNECGNGSKNSPKTKRGTGKGHCSVLTNKDLNQNQKHNESNTKRGECVESNMPVQARKITPQKQDNVVSPFFNFFENSLCVFLFIII